jgi:hypothetical protein
VQVPTDDSGDVTLTAPFTFQGQLTAAPVREPGPDAITLRVTLTGAGVATLRLSSSLDPESGQRLYFFRDLTYEFTATPGQ